MDLGKHVDTSKNGFPRQLLPNAVELIYCYIVYSYPESQRIENSAGGLSMSRAASKRRVRRGPGRTQRAGGGCRRSGMRMTAQERIATSLLMTGGENAEGAEEAPISSMGALIDHPSYSVLMAINIH
jgi:hypothetical protein